MDLYKKKRKSLRDDKREMMKESDFRSSDERKAAVKAFKRMSRSLKRSERNNIKKLLKEEYGL